MLLEVRGGAQFVKARMRARRNACRASARQRAASPTVTEKATKSLPHRLKKFFHCRRGRGGDFGRAAVSLAMIRRTAANTRCFSRAQRSTQRQRSGALQTRERRECSVRNDPGSAVHRQ
jgi:hypothetical protein